MLIFDSRPDPERQPDRLRTIARLKGITCTPVSKARVLDIGCGTGLDLIAHALCYPQASFVGIDIADNFIKLGKQLCHELNISNIELVLADIKDYSSKEKFDYIICHGVYSWVNANIQSAILKLLHNVLKPNGIAYVSFNTLPGWHFRRVVQRCIRSFDNPKLSPEERVELAIQSMQKAILALSDLSGPQVECLNIELAACIKQSPAFIFHELLNFDCSAQYLDEFIDTANTHNLKYVGDGRPTRMRELRFSAAEKDRSSQLGIDTLNSVDKEQFWDLMQPLALRGVLLCHSSNTVSAIPEYSQIMDMHVTSGLSAESANLDVASSSTEVFSTPRQLLVEVQNPELKATLDKLAKTWPKTIAVKDLLLNSDLPSSSSNMLVTLGEYFFQGLLELYNEPLITSARISEKPQVFPLAIAQAKIGFAWVTNSRFEYVPINEFDRELIQCLDGTQTISQICDVLLLKIENNQVITQVSKDHEGQELSFLLVKQIDATIEHYLETGLLV